MRHRLRTMGLALVLTLAAAVVVDAGPLEVAARQAGRPLIVRFGLDRCLQCIKQARAFDALEPKYQDKLEFRFVHIGKEEEMAGLYKVLLIPTVLFFDAEGNEVFRYVGYLAPEELEAEFRRTGLARAAAGG